MRKSGIIKHSESDEMQYDVSDPSFVLLPNLELIPAPVHYCLSNLMLLTFKDEIHAAE